MTDTTDFPDLIALAHEHCRAVHHYDGHQDGYEFHADGLASFASEILADRASRAPAPLVSFMRELFAVTTHAEAFGDGNVSAKALRELMNQHAAAPSAVLPEGASRAGQPTSEDVLTEIRTIMNGTQHWPVGAGIVDAIRALAAGIPAAPPAPDLLRQFAEGARLTDEQIGGLIVKHCVKTMWSIKAAHAFAREVEEAANRALSAQQEGGKP